MANKGKQAKEYLDSELGKAKNLLREKEFSPEAKQDLLKNLSEDEVSLIQKNRRTESVKKAKESWNVSKSKEEYKNAQTEYQENIQLRKKLMEKGISLEEAQKLLFGEESKKSEKKEAKETDPISLQKEIMERAKKGTDHHRAWLQKKTDELVKNRDKAALEQLNKGIDFTAKGGLIINTLQGPLKFAPEQATFDDVKGINGIKENKNIWTENEVTHKKGLRANWEATKKMRNAGKKIYADKQFLAVANVFPGGDELNVNNWSTKVKDFFDLLGVDQYGFRDPDGKWNNNNRYLWSASGSWFNAYHMGCRDSKGTLDQADKTYGFGVWFLED